MAVTARSAQDIEMLVQAGTYSSPASAINCSPRSRESRFPYFEPIPNELKLLFIIDSLDLEDINSLVCTSRAENRLLTPYMYRHAKDLKSRYARPCILRAVDGGNFTALRQFIEVGTSINMSDRRVPCLPTSLHSCAKYGNVAIAQLLVQNGVEISAVNKVG
jgi:hypothetical protein